MRGRAMRVTHHYKSPLGGVTMLSDGEALLGLWFDGQKYFPADLPAREGEKNLPVWEQADRWLALYFAGKKPDFLPPLRMETTPFRRRVWQELLKIPYGQTTTYGELARRIASERGVDRFSAQAVGGAVGHNAISLMIPCHRVVGSGGELTGYAGGIEKKRALLTLEGVTLSKQDDRILK